MKPYYQDDGIQIFNADQRDVLPALSDHSINLFLTDPPYGLNFNIDGAIYIVAYEAQRLGARSVHGEWDNASSCSKSRTAGDWSRVVGGVL